MKRVMIIGQPGSGKSTFARKLGDITFLPVHHIDHIHWQAGWIERPGPEKDKLIAGIIANERWIFEGGRSSTWPERLQRADTLIWLDIPLYLRSWRVVWRTIRHYGRSRADLPEGCPERFDLEFSTYIWRTRHTSRNKMLELYQSAPTEKQTYRLGSISEMNSFLDDLKRAVAVGNLGIPHR